MFNVRRWMLLVCLCVLFSGLGYGQAYPMCNASSVPPQLRSEGLTELTGDIFLVCTGGNPPGPGTPALTATITVYVNGTVTSRLLGSGGASEALLLIDDPGSQSPSATGVPYGETVPAVACGSAQLGAGPGGCVEYVGANGSTPANYAAFSSSNNLGVLVGGSATSGSPGANVFQGVVSGNTITFNNVPVLPLVGTIRTLRITNIRVNALGIAGGPSNTGSVVVSISGLPVTYPGNTGSIATGYIFPTLTTSQTKAFSTSNAGFSNSITLSQNQSYPSSGSTPVALETLVFSEARSTAFRPRGSTSQNVPAAVTYTESGLTISGVPGSGYADWGTRLKAVFSNIPNGVSLYVSTTNLNSGYNAPMGAVANAGSLTASSFAMLITSETAADTGPSAALVNNFTPWVPAVAQTGASNASVTVTTAASPVGFAPLTTTNGSASAVWEVVNSIPTALENFAFEVFVVQTGGVPSAPSTMVVNMSYAPDPTQGAFTLSAGSTPSSTLGIARFADTSTAQTALSILAPTSVPALSPWALAILAILLLAGAAMLLRPYVA
jgi:hypothetical protein